MTEQVSSSSSSSSSSRQVRLRRREQSRWNARGAKGGASGRKREARERGREETSRRVSLGSGAGLFNEPAHSTPPSSVAPAGWRPPGSGSAAGGPVPSLLSRGWRFTLSGCLWSNRLTHKDTCMDSKWPKKHPFKFSLTNKHKKPWVGGGLRLHRLSLFLPSCHRDN